MEPGSPCFSVLQPGGSANVNYALSRIRWYLSHFDYGKEVKSLNEVIRVDDMVRGCPMKVPSFLQTLNKYLEQFGVVEHA